MGATHLVRPARPADCAALLVLMRELARFEGYLAQFRVTGEALLERGWGGAPQFAAFVAEAGDGRLLAYAVVYFVPFTFDLRPNLVLKELFVSSAERGQGLGHALMAAVLEFARLHGCGRLKWDVLPDNAAAQAFYRSLGGAPDTQWENWIRVLD